MHRQRGGIGLHQVDLKLDGRVVGRVTWSQGDGGLGLYAACPIEEGFIYRVMLVLAGDQFEVLGVMLPQRGKFVLEKQLSPALSQKVGLQLQNLVAVEILRNLPGEAPQIGPLCFPLSLMAPCQAGDIAMLPPETQEQLLEEGVLCHCHEGETYLAAPLNRHQPFALNSVFCLATPLGIGGKNYGIVKVDENGFVSAVHIRHRSG